MTEQQVLKILQNLWQDTLNLRKEHPTCFSADYASGIAYGIVQSAIHLYPQYENAIVTTWKESENNWREKFFN